MRAQGSGRTFRAALTMLILLCGVTSVHATSVETLLMPGKVTKAHQKQEENCASCHDRANVRTQTSLCLDCHKDIAADVKGRQKYHGRMANAGAGECRACHTEHKGRDADIVRLDRAQFDHGLTDFALEGAHGAVACGGCHRTAEPWRRASVDCGGCHKADDFHLAQFTQSCGACHGAATWSGGRFDHDATDFKLTGAHAGLSCDGCHIGGRYAQTPKTCNGCHATDDEHRGSRGEDCGKCHVTKEWKAAKYDHLKETGYALLGAHERITCNACHRSGNDKEPIPRDCNGCHKADDAHAARFGAKCADCHGEARWAVPDYDHAGKHGFALQGGHAAIDCHACHTAPLAVQRLAKDCAGCHRSEDPHGGKLQGGCDSCHGQHAWRSDLSFDHDLVQFPLLGMHRVVGCAQCHSTLAFQAAAQGCVDCHASDDVHKGGLGRKCESCHSANGWPLWQFDHGKQTHFPLLGAHGKLQCADCHHEAPGMTKMPLQCAGCHRKDDRHLGEYGAQCDRCHSVDSWKGARIQ